MNTIEPTAPAKSLEQLKAEAEAAAAALKQAEQAEREKTEEQRRAAEREKMIHARKATHAKWLPIFESIADAIRARGVQATVKHSTDFSGYDGDKPKMQLPSGVYLNVHHNGKLRLSSAGDGGAYYGRRASGTFNIEGIAKQVADIVAARIAQEKREADKRNAANNSKAIAEDLRQQFGVKPYTSRLEIETSQYDASRVYIKMTRHLTKEEASRLLAVLKEAELL